MLGGRFFTRLAVFASMWLVMYTLGIQLGKDSIWAFLCILALSIVLEILAYQYGVVQGILIYRDLTPEQRKDIERIIKENNNE